MNRKQKVALIARVVVLGATVVVALAAIEVAARIIYSRPSMHFGIEMWKYARSVKMPADNEALSHRHQPGAQAFLMGAEVKINSLGLRDREIAATKPAGTYRVVVLGDSTTFGWGVPQDAVYPKVIERAFNENPPSAKWRRYEVLNTGVGNYNTAQEVASFKERWLALDPDLVLLCWYINDAEPTPRPSRNWLAYRSYGYVWITTNFDSLTRNVGAQRTYRDYYNSLYEPAQPGWRKCQDAIGELAALCGARGIPLRLLLQPELHTLPGSYEFEPLHTLVAEAGRAHGVPVLDLLPAFPGDGDPRRFWVSPEDAHPNAAANDLMGRFIDAAARRERWIE
ncbi:MAG: SGNH/GDSL hydrolase family protein [Chthoniobacteraceae bacterium]